MEALNMTKSAFRLAQSGALILSLMATTLVSGCITLLPKPGKPPSIVTLRADPTLLRSQNPAPFTIGVGLPTMPAILAGNKIAVRQEDGGYAYVDRLQLSAAAPQAIQSLILETYDRAGGARAAVRALTVARPDFEIHFDINAFEVTEPEGRQPGIARIESGVRLVEVYTGRPLASTILSAEVPAPRGERTNPALALEKATRQLALQAVNWSVRTATPFHASRAASTTR
jgi:cholesterol transport system auxiliary component